MNKRYDVEIEYLDNEGNVVDSSCQLLTDDYNEALDTARKVVLTSEDQQVSIWTWDDKNEKVVDSNVVKNIRMQKTVYVIVGINLTDRFDPCQDMDVKLTTDDRAFARRELTRLIKDYIESWYDDEEELLSKDKILEKYWIVQDEHWCYDQGDWHMEFRIIESRLV
jgi:hypothetical protein